MNFGDTAPIYHLRSQTDCHALPAASEANTRHARKMRTAAKKAEAERQTIETRDPGGGTRESDGRVLSYGTDVEVSPWRLTNCRIECSRRRTTIRARNVNCNYRCAEL